MFATLVVLLLASAPSPPPNAESVGAIPFHIRDRALREGRVRLLLELRLPAGRHLPEGQLVPAAVAAQRSDVRHAGRQVLLRLAGRAHRVLHQYDTVPFVALEVGPDALADLDASTFWVARVLEDALHAPTLGQSVPLVGGSTAWSRGLDGTGTVVAILDTGVESAHPFLAGKVVEEACYSSNVSGTSTSECPSGLETQTGPGAARPCTLNGCWHGTHVAGIAAGNGASAGVAFSGVAKGAEVMAVQVFSRFTRQADCGSAPCALAWTSDIIAGLERVYALRSSRNIAAANLSLGGALSTVTCDGEPTKAIIDNLRSVGIATVVASGNNGATNAISAPACISSAVSVGATTKSDVVASYSNVASFLSLFAPGSSIQSSVLGGAYGGANGTSMATPHVTGAWAVVKQAAPNATVAEILSVLQATGVTITDTRSGVSKPRIRLDQALTSLAPSVSVTSVTPSQGSRGTSVSVTIAGSGFAAGAAVSAGAGITTSNVNVLSQSQITATLTISAAATLGSRDVSVTNPGAASAVLTGGFTVNAATAATLSVSYSGKIRDRVGQGNAALGPDGAADGVLTVTLNATGGRTVTGIRLDSSGPGTWDTDAASAFWALGVATSVDGSLLNNPATMAVSLGVANGGTFVLFGADYADIEFVPGATLTVRATFSDGTTATATTTVTAAPPPSPPPPSSPASLSVAYNDKLRDRVGQGNTALSQDGAMDGTLTVTLNADGGRTVTGLRLESTGPGTWDTSATSAFWALGVAATVDGPLVNHASTMAVSFVVPNGGTFVLFAADYADIEFVTGATLTVTATFSDGSTATAATTAGGGAPPAPPSPSALGVTYNGKLRDRVGQGNTALSGDGALDGTLTVTLNASGGRTITRLRLDSSGPGTWDTDGASAYWALGVATSLSAPLLNNTSTMAVGFTVADGGSFVLFASDYANIEFTPGATLTVTARFSDGTTVSAVKLVP